jgi:hypothetical protein
MERDDIAVMLGMFAEIYGQKSENPKILIDLWHRYLTDEPADLVQQAADKYIAGNKFFPKPSEILELIEKRKWELYSSTISIDFFYTGPKELPPEYLPRGVNRRLKQYELSNGEKTIKALQGFDKIGLIE